MAKLSSDGKSVTVQSGDTLSAIALKYLGSASKYKELAAINNISNPNRIYVGQVIKLYADGESPSTTSTPNNSNCPSITHFGLQSDADKTLFATWTWSKENTESFKVLWTYDTGDSVWFIGSSSDNTIDEDVPNEARQSTYSIPDNAKKIKFKVKPISKKKDNSDKTYWTADWSEEKSFVVSDSLPPEAPTGLSVEIEGYKLTMSLDGLDEEITSVKFQIVKDNKKVVHTQTVTVETGHASYEYTAAAGSEYKVRCCAMKGDLEGEWSEYVIPDGKTAPITPSGITVLRAISETSIHIEWGESPTAASYEIEYATKREYFDVSDQTDIIPVSSSNYDPPPHAFTISDLETGQEYFFRVRAVGENGNVSDWCDIKSIVIGTDPAAPTTWSSTTTAIVGEDLTLYWVHNTEDGSSQVTAELEFTIDGEVVSPTITVRNSTNEDLKDKTSFCTVDTETGHVRWTEDPTDESDDGSRDRWLGVSFKEGTKLEWRVRTSGITNKFGDWSISRKVDIYARPTLDLRITDSEADNIQTLESFPFYIRALPGPNTQAPISYHLSIISNSIYETVDNVGNVITVNAGEEVYYKHFDTQYELLVEMSANNVNLQGNVEYTVKCTVAMNSGLTAEAYVPFTVAWVDAQYMLNAEIGIDANSLTASITPYCEDHKLTYYKVTRSGTKYLKTEEPVWSVYGEIVKGKRTTTGERVYSGVTSTGEELYYCIVEEVASIDSVYLSVYRREFDGSFTEIGVNLDGAKRTTVTDPHPALDYARYRIVAKDKATGAISYYDPPGHPVGGTAVIIQWAEEWSSFDTTEDAPLEQPPWSGSLLKLPYNIDVSDSHDIEVELVKYIGREHPVTYYGTQRGHTASWNVEIEKDDEETLYGLRRLARWMGDVYVREPSGSGYWAAISVSFSQRHCEVTIPVTLNVTRVEGGV